MAIPEIPEAGGQADYVFLSRRLSVGSFLRRAAGFSFREPPAIPANDSPSPTTLSGGTSPNNSAPGYCLFSSIFFTSAATVAPL